MTLTRWSTPLLSPCTPSPSCLAAARARRSPLVLEVSFSGTVRHLLAPRVGAPSGRSAGRCLPKRLYSCPHVRSTLRWREGRMSQARHYRSGRRARDKGGEARTGRRKEGGDGKKKEERMIRKRWGEAWTQGREVKAGEGAIEVNKTERRIKQKRQ